MFFGLLFFLAFGLSLLVTPLTEKLAYHYHFLDVPDGRKRHKVPIPLLGGLSIYGSFCLSLFFCYLTRPDYLGLHQSLFFGLFFGGTLIFLAGLLNDAYGLSTLQKRLIQIPAVIVLIYFSPPGNVVNVIIPDFPDTLWTRYLDILIFILWIVILTDAIISERDS